MASAIDDGRCAASGRPGPIATGMAGDAGGTGVAAGARIVSIDALRGLVMAIMLIDHIRETFFLHMQVGDPVDARTVMPALVATRLVTTICAPVFVALTGLSAWLYAQKNGRAAATRFLITRGLFLLVLEVTLVGIAWGGGWPPTKIWLQVIWAIGACMIALAALIHLPRVAIALIGGGIVLGHNLLDGIVLAPGDAWFVPWAMLHQRAVIEVAGVAIKTTYPVLPWIGVIALGYAMGPWFLCPAAERRRRLVTLGCALLAGFALLRGIDVYGDRSWSVVAGDPVRTAMSALALTKYPPSLLFLALTLGIGALLLAGLERAGPATRWLTVFGGAPMFFYLLHLYVLRALYLGAVAIWGTNRGTVFGFDSLIGLWLLYPVLLAALYLPTRWFAQLKRRRRDLRWLSYL